MLLRPGAVSEKTIQRKEGNKKLNRQGFTMAETLIVVAILLVLFALAIVGIIAIQRNLRQKELDAKAEIIYMAAQEQLVNLHASGVTYDDGYRVSSKAGGSFPMDMAGTEEEKAERTGRLKYITKGDPDSADKVALPAVMIDEEIWSNKWVIEYDPNNGTVYAVFYSETEPVQNEYNNSWSEYNKLRGKTVIEGRNNRIKKGAKIGYYGGDASTGREAKTLEPTIIVSNGEELKVKLKVVAPDNVHKIHMKLTLSDESGHKYTEDYNYGLNGASDQILESNGTFTKEIVLDSLKSDDTRFDYKYGEQSNHIGHKLVPGENLTLRLVADVPGNNTFQLVTASAVTNSLFDDSKEKIKDSKTARIACGRHLQNLDVSSGVTDEIEKAEQVYDVSFADDPSKSNDWYSVYSRSFFHNVSTSGLRKTAKFKPIELTDKMETYDGGNRYISSLNVQESGDAALFKEIEGVTIKDLYLTGPYVKVTGDNTAGGLVANVKGENNSIEGVGLFLTTEDIDEVDALNEEKDIYPWISGKTAGGLIGKAVSGSHLTITESFASTVIGTEESSDHSGGLIGFADTNRIELQKSYTDSYIYGENTASLACTDNDIKVNKIEYCYAAGFQTATVSEAGLVNGNIDELVKTYTIVAKKSDKDAARYYSIAKNVESNPSDTFYLNKSSNPTDDISQTTNISEYSKAQLKDELGNNFRSDTTDAVTNQYHLMDQALNSYDYPLLTEIKHHGDWIAKFQNGALVYYEKYSDGTYGFYGANEKSSLKNKGTIVGDGYGVIYQQDKNDPRKNIPESVSVKIGNSEQISLNKELNTTVGRTGYYILPIPAGNVNNTNGFKDSFYKRVTIFEDGNAGDSYYFNPLFAKTAVNSTGDAAPEVPDQISIRSPRHLYKLSQVYSDLREVTKEKTYKQERNLNYSLYDWSFANENNTINAQGPIGRDPKHSFIAEYDGSRNVITDVSFETRNDNYVGMFGYNGKAEIDSKTYTGTLKNIIIATNYDPESSKHFLVKRSGNVTANTIVHMGVLAGYNEGMAENCAVAGYYIAGAQGTVHAFRNSTLYIGGLVGTNTGSISKCSSECPEIRLSSLYADVDLGGLVGHNTASGSISNTYAIAYLEVAEAKGDKTVQVGGFAAANQGTIRSSYCATAIETSGNAIAYGFSPYANGIVTPDCYYLNEGTYQFINGLRSYNYDATEDEHLITYGTPKKYDELKRISPSARASSRHSYYDPSNGDDAYPFRAVITDSSGNYVHYGDWPTEPALGMRGVFYWEHEEGSSNSGYHFTYIGIVDGENGAEDQYFSGTTLCNAHDDDGVITEYGYGYFVARTATGNPAFTSEKGFGNVEELSIGSTHNSGVATEIEKQLPSYRFYPYVTGTTGDDCIYLNTLEDSDGKVKTSGNAVFTYPGKKTLKFEITPFFANAMQLTEVGNNSSVDGLVPVLTTSDWRDIDFTATLGSEQNSFETRSVSQFGYINWNCRTKNCDTLVYGLKDDNNAYKGNYRQFPFLQFATIVKKGVQQKSAVIAKRPVQYWNQSHDIMGTDGANELKPIAGMATSTTLKDYINILYAWFGGSYDGESYKIENINVDSEAYTVGLFGVAAGADIKNVVLYSSSGNNYIKRNTAGKTATIRYKEGSADKEITINFAKNVGAYSVGGLIGIAYDYYQQATGKENKIENCAIAGYKVIDASTNQQGNGTANFGGLVGLSNANLTRCSAVTDMEIRCTHVDPPGSTDYTKQYHCQYGSYERVGGLAGSVGGPEGYLTVKNCYSGGSIKDFTPTEEKPCKYDSSGYAVRDSGGVGYSSNMFISGMVGGSYAPNISNFTNKDANQPDGKARIENCYTYVKLPDMAGNIRAVSYFANMADRYGRDTKIELKKCFYLKEVNEDFKVVDPGYYFQANTGRKTLSPTEITQMLNGNLQYLTWLLYKQTNTGVYSPTGDQPVGVTYEDLSRQKRQITDPFTDPMTDRLGGPPWGWVTDYDEIAEVSIKGKYSFSNLPDQEGKDYPFPTVHTQDDITYSTKDVPYPVNVHYGEWFYDGWRWENSRDSLDIFAVGMTAGGYAEKDFKLLVKADDEGNVRPPEFDYSEKDEDGNPTIAEVVNASLSSDKKFYTVTVRALNEGSVTITEKDSGAELDLEVTAKLKLDSSAIYHTSEGELLLYLRNRPETANLSLSAVSEIDPTKDYSSSETEGVVSWSLFCDDSDAFAFDNDRNTGKDRIVRGLKPGSYTIGASYTYNYPGRSEGETVPITGMIAVRARTLGSIGLYNNSGNENHKGDYTGEIRGIETTDSLISGWHAPDGAEVLILGSAEDGDLGAFIIDEENSFVIPAEGTSAEDYDLKFSTETADFDEYSTRACYVTYKGPYREDPLNVGVTLSLKDPVKEYVKTGSGDSETEKEYTLTMNNVMVPKHVVSFAKAPDSEEASNVSGTMYTVGVKEGDYRVPECSYSKPGYTFLYWTDSEGNKYKSDGDYSRTISIGADTGNIVLTANWEMNNYTLKFAANGGTGVMPSKTLRYDETYVLPENSFDVPEGYVFDEWNRRSDGTGDSYKPGDVVSMLTTGDSVTLYAQWKTANTLSLVNMGQTVGAFYPDGKTQIDDYDDQVASKLISPGEGWSLDGWYDSEQAGCQKIRDSDGRIVDGLVGVDGIINEDGEFELDGNHSLYALWTKKCYAPVDSVPIEDPDPSDLDAEGDGNNVKYLIVSGTDTEETQQAMCIGLDGSGNPTIPASIGTTVSGGGLIKKLVNNDEQLAESVFIDDPDEKAVWLFEKIHTERNPIDYYTNADKYFSIRNKWCKDNEKEKSYLREQNKALELRDAVEQWYQDGNTYTVDRQLWNIYDGKYLKSQRIINKNWAASLFYKTTQWYINTDSKENGPVTLFKYQDVYSFFHSEE